MKLRYTVTGMALGIILACSSAVPAQASGLSLSVGENLSGGIAGTIGQVSASGDAANDLKTAASETLWVGTPLEGYSNIAISNVDDNLNIRSTPSTDGKLVGKLRSNAACNVEYIEGDWAFITSGKVEGYVKAEFLIMGDEAIEKALELGYTAARSKTGGLNVRMEPSTDSTILTQMAEGEQLEVVEEGEEWIKVDLDGETGYVFAEYVEIRSELPTALTITEALYGEGVSDVRMAVCEYAKQFVGNPYVWGGTSLTRGADCSGFVLSVMKNYGISLPHSSRAQANCGSRVSVSDVKPGDLIFYGSGKSIGHVAIYIGNGMIVHASNAREGIKISNMYYRTPICATRVLSN